MARPAVNHEGKKQQIVEAALLTFAQYGYEGTTNKLIAQQAGGISPALIYHYFPVGKRQLFQAVLQQFQPLQTLIETIHSYQEAPPQEFLSKVTQTYMEILQQANVISLLRILMFEAPRQPEVAQIFIAQVGPTLILPLVTYLQNQTALGNFRSLPPMAGPLLLFGPLLARSLIIKAIEDQVIPIPTISPEEMIESVVQTFLFGVGENDFQPAIARKDQSDDQSGSNNLNKSTSYSN